MVHTRLSYNKDVNKDITILINGNLSDNGNNQEWSDVNGVEKPNDKKGDDDDDVKDDHNIIRQESNAILKSDHPRKRRRMLSGMYDNFHYDSIQPRTLRSIRHQRRSTRHASTLRYAPLDSFCVRRSDRRMKRIFETFNEQEIHRSIEKRQKEMLEAEQASMYDSIKRRRGDTDTQDDGSSDDEETNEEDSHDEEVEESSQPAYSLRKTKPQTNKYQAPPIHGGSGRQRREVMFTGPRSPLSQIRQFKRVPQHSSSPRHSRRNRRSSSTSSEDEAAFERRKAKSMARGRVRCLPMNYNADDIVGVLKNRKRAGEARGSSLADVDPMTIDDKTTFQDIGGLDHHIRSLKEMVVFPLVYPEVFAKFHITPPRGVLFYGPPGTGKTLVARALANECSKDGKKVAFFMRKGADCLSKWVGESERQLRLLFDQAYTMRPSIIFFDEIDGIAPVRSTRQDQIHSSIVSTLLALMDGLDARGEIVVIGATNRLDSIDPALRRPGRFDREFLFNLPNRTAREKVLNIHTSSWQPKLSKDFVQDIAGKCVGYCGADIKALCTEAALIALRRRYPQIYNTTKKLVLDVDKIKISHIDFKNAMKILMPASSRSIVTNARKLPDNTLPLLSGRVDDILKILKKIFPLSVFCKEEEDISNNDPDEHADEISYTKNTSFDLQTVHKPRLLVHGSKGSGVSSYIGPALLYAMEHITTHTIDLSSVFSNSSRTPEEALSLVFREAKRNLPSIIYLPHIGVMYNSISELTRATFMTMLLDTPPTLPILLLATAECELHDLPEEIIGLFSRKEQTFSLSPPSSNESYEYFKDLLLVQALKSPSLKNMPQNELEVLEEASPPKPRELSANERKALIASEDNTLRELRIFLRDVTWKLLADRKFKEFSKPVDIDEVDDYLHVVNEPMDLSTVMTRINSHHYNSCAHYLRDVDLITSNCLEYNPDKDQFDRLLRNRACEMKDVAYALIYSDLDPEFEKLCLEINESRKNRGYDEKANEPAFMKVIPRLKLKSVHDNDWTKEQNDCAEKSNPIARRYSNRVRGISDPLEINLDALIEGRRRKSQPKKGLEKEESSSPCKIDDADEALLTVAVAIDDCIADEDACVNRAKRTLEFDEMPVDESVLMEQATSLLNDIVKSTKRYSLDQLEEIHVVLSQTISEHLKTQSRLLVLDELKEAADRLFIQNL